MELKYSQKRKLSLKIGLKRALAYSWWYRYRCFLNFKHLEIKTIFITYGVVVPIAIHGGGCRVPHQLCFQPLHPISKPTRKLTNNRGCKMIVSCRNLRTAFRMLVSGSISNSKHGWEVVLLKQGQA